MDKVKKIFSPGSKKDDEVLYGDAGERRRESASKAPEPREPEQLRPVEGSHKKEHSIMRQLVNSGGEKFDDQRFGTTATTAPGDPNKLETHPEAHKKDHTILGQVLNPSGDKYDAQRFESAASTEGDRRQSVRPEAPPIAGPDVKLQTDPEEKKHEHSILRQIINPGGGKYDEEGYGTTAHAAGSLGNAPSDTKDHSVARQILNPGQEKYDPVVHGGSGEPGPSGTGATSTGLQHPTQATTGASATGVGADRRADPITGGTISPSTGGDDTASCLSIKSGVAGPFAHGADVHGLGSSNAAAGQSTIPGSQGTDFGRDAAIVGGGAAAAGAGAAAYSNDKPKHDIPSSTTTTMTTTTAQHPQPLADRSVAGGSHINPVGAPESGVQQAGDSHLGRDAAIAGGAGLAGGAAYGQLHQPKDSDVAAATYTERSQPLAGSSQTYNSSSAGGEGPVHFGTASTTTPHTGTGTGTGGAHINPVGAPEGSLEGQPRLGQDAALAGGIGAAGVAAGSGVTQLNKAPNDVQQATYTERAYPVGSTSHNDGVIHHARGPHQTETANKLDPHLPGEFPTETGEDKHGLNPTTLAGASPETGLGSPSAPATVQDKQTIGSRISAGVAGIASAVGFSSSKKTDEPTVAEPATTSSKDYASSQPLSGATATTEQPTEHHYGRDAAVVGGLGAATREHDNQRPAEPQLGSTTTTSQPTTTTTTTTSTSTAPTRSTEPQVASAPTTQPTGLNETANDSHLGRDVAVAGGAGAAGVGAYEASKDTGPASKTIGPHDSNVANIVDPKVQPQPEKMKESTTTGPYSSDIANKADPRVQADPAKAGEEETHYGRDAAVAGGVGAAGAGAYSATRDDKPATTHAQPDSSDPAVIAARRAAEKESHPSTSDKHGKSHAEEGGEKKRGLLDKILHPGRKSEDKDHSHGFSSTKTATDTDGHTKLHKKALGDAPHHETSTFAGNEAQAGAIIEPHTGLPMNVEKYGTTGAGGTDGARQIEGYHETNPAVRQATHGTAKGAGTKHPAHQAGEEGVAGPDWDAIKKANTPY